MACSIQAVCLIPEMFNQAATTVPEILTLAIWQHPSSQNAAIISPCSTGGEFYLMGIRKMMDFSGFNLSIFCYQDLLQSHSQCQLQSPGTARGQL